VLYFVTEFSHQSQAATCWFERATTGFVARISCYCSRLQGLRCAWLPTVCFLLFAYGPCACKLVHGTCTCLQMTPLCGLVAHSYNSLKLCPCIPSSSLCCPAVTDCSSNALRARQAGNMPEASVHAAPSNTAMMRHTPPSTKTRDQ